jgi:type II secretory pathway pseudopilin PulG
MLIELVIAMSVLAIAIGALLAVFASSMLSLRRATIQGTALTLADRQIEVYKTLLYADIRLDAATMPVSGTDPYNTANAADATIPPSSPQVTGAVAPSCTLPAQAQHACAVQTWNGPDGRNYRIDTYVIAATPAGGRAGKQVTVVVRQIQGGTVGSKAIARATSAFDPASPPS